MYIKKMVQLLNVLLAILRVVEMLDVLSGDITMEDVLLSLL